MRTALASPKLRVSAPMAIALHISFDDVVRAPHKSSSHIRNSFPGAFFPPIEELDDSDDSSSQQVSPKHAKQHKRSISNFAASYSGHHIPRDSTPSGQRPKARKVGDTDKEARSSRRVQSDKDFESIARRQNSALTMLQPSNGLAPHDRKASIVSNASSRSYSHDATSTPTMAMIAQEREANMRTPRPHTASAAQTASAKQRVEPGLLAEAPEAVSQKDHSRILQWQQRRDPSDATIEANEPARTYYPSDSLGRMSVASSAFASGSEYGPSLRTGSESGHDWAATSVTSGSGAQRRGRKVAPPELLVVVRPPPSKQGNPLNLQIQLVTPQAPSGAASPNGQGRISGESSRDELVPPGSSSSIVSITNGASAHGGLRRSNSVSSSRSAISDASSAGFSSVSASSSSRRVTPLYNLCFHSIMPTTVTDAGTDQKVAKFSKRGVEIDGLGILVPHELALGVNDLSTLERRRRSSAALSGGPASETSASLVSSDNQAHPDVRSEASSARGVSATSDSGGSGKGLPPSEKAGEPPTSFDAMSPQAKEPVSDPMGGLGGKLMRGFKRFSLNPVINAPTPPKRETGAAPSVRSASTLDTTAPTSILARMRGAAVKMKDGESIASEMMEGLGSDYTSATGDIDLEVPQLVVGAGIRGDGSRRTQGYYWTVKKWNRRLDEDDDLAGDNVPGRHEHGANPILNSVWKRFNLMNRMGGTEQHPPSHQIPVRFEWTRQEMRRRSGHASASNSSAAARNNNTAGGGHGRAATDMGGALASNGRRSMRTSIDVRPAEHESVPTSNASEADGLPSSDAPALRLHPGKSSSRPSSVYSAGGVSPVRGSLDRGGEESDPEDSETTWACHLVLGPTTRIPIGILAPTPHHPKLVAQLTVPYPLPDLSQSGLGADGAGLTREELKDIISVTSLFVIVREAFGGLAKRRKGDSALKFGAAVAQRQ